jgi:predicted P-loop ATPase
MSDKISLFIPAFSKQPAAEISIPDFVTAIRYGKWKREVEAVRNQSEPDLRKKAKQGVPGVTISGTFSERKEANLAEHSGFICIDIDSYTTRDSLVTDIYTYALFSSISNSGLAVIVKINPAKHKESFRWIQEYYFKSFGISVDPAPSNCASLRFVSYDPQCFINEESKVAKTTAKKLHKIHSLPTIIPTDKVGEMVHDAVARGANIAEDYQSYVTLGFALAAGFGEDGRQYFHALAGISNKYNSEHTDKQYNYCLRNPGGGITVGSFYWMLKNAGVPFPQNERYENAVRVAAIAKKANRTESGVVEQLQEINGIPQVDAERIAHEVFERSDISLTSIAQDPEKLIESMVAWMGMNHPMKKNTITNKLENSKGEVTKEEMNTIYLQARAGFNTPNVTFDLIERIVFSNFTPQFHPIKDYIKANRHRNTTGNIDRIIASIQTPTKGADFFVRKWLISLAAAVDGYPVRLVLALVGKQLTGKTEWFRRLLPEKLGKYYGESKMDAGKDDELLMTQKLIIMDDEMSGKNKTDEKRFKDLTSKHTFSLRAPYDKSNMDYRRLAVLCGTSNDKEVINDPTGNTRILPVDVVSIDFEACNSVDKDELFMEIIRAYEGGENWNFEQAELDTLTEVSNTFEAIPFERELVLKYFTRAEEAEGNGFVEEMGATEIKNYIEERTKQQIRSLKRLGMELHSIFGERKSVRKAGKVVNVYSVVKLQDGAGQPSEGIPVGINEADLPF